MSGNTSVSHRYIDRRAFIGGSDARVIMGDDEAALVRLWKEKRGEVEPQDLSGNLIVQLGVVTEDLNRRCTSAIRPSAGWPPRRTGAFNPAAPSSSRSSCCPGIFPKKRPP